MLEIYFNDMCLVASGAKNALTLPGALHSRSGRACRSAVRTVQA